MARVGERIRRVVVERARERCEYCHAPQSMLGYRLHVEHIIPTARGGSDALDNLASSCGPCNFAKGAALKLRDSTGAGGVPLFDPRVHRWHEHFAWGEDGITLVGMTPIGVATIVMLDINQPLQLSARRGWRQLGLLS